VIYLSRPAGDEGVIPLVVAHEGSERASTEGYSRVPIVIYYPSWIEEDPHDSTGEV
jgi:hypothetical protein